MAEYDVIVYGTIREVYTVEADSAAEAAESWYHTDPWVSEVQECEVFEVRECL